MELRRRTKRRSRVEEHEGGRGFEFVCTGWYTRYPVNSFWLALGEQNRKWCLSLSFSFRVRWPVLVGRARRRFPQFWSAMWKDLIAMKRASAYERTEPVIGWLKIGGLRCVTVAKVTKACEHNERYFGPASNPFFFSLEEGEEEREECGKGEGRKN